MIPTYKPIPREEALEIIKNIDILLLTATDVETQCLHEQMMPEDGIILKVGIDVHTYFIGNFGNYRVLHTQCKAGSATLGGSAVVTAHAINLIKPKAILMIGIAFGLNKTKQKIGDVLISESLWPYDISRIGEKTVHRGGNPRASTFLVNRFKDLNWEYNYTIGKAKKVFKSKVSQGVLFSGEKLVDNLEFRQRLQLEVPEAIGGEMEGSGIATAADGTKTDWIVVKSICDFADGQKKNNKSANQRAAALAAVAYCQKVLSEDHIFSEIGITATDFSKNPSIIDTQLVLFKRYTNAAEPYYHVRAIDHWFNGYIDDYSIWLHGESGSGKTTVIMRNLLQRKREIIQICLASGAEYDINSILTELLAKLSIHFNVSSADRNGQTQEDLIAAISQLIIAKFDFNRQIIYIDEIPEFKDDSIIAALFHSMYAINIKILNIVPDARLVFVLSSISSPMTTIHDSQKKVLESFKFEHLTGWGDSDVSSLLIKIITSLQIEFQSSEIVAIKKAANKSPRAIKRIVRDYLATQYNNHISLDRILAEIQAEL
ncbi:MAG: Nucleoside phosphorylase-like protein [Segetibacter sp.]|nr:Nucleoside phosphorylase-like protein [Segetibacter sp.]